jgi:hypothetical protein
LCPITIILLLRTLHRHALCETHCTDNGYEKWTWRAKSEIWFVGEIKEGDEQGQQLAGPRFLFAFLKEYLALASGVPRIVDNLRVRSRFLSW